LADGSYSSRQQVIQDFLKKILAPDYILLRVIFGAPTIKNPYQKFKVLT
jgi:hypothetical protein